MTNGKKIIKKYEKMTCVQMNVRVTSGKNNFQLLERINIRRYILSRCETIVYFSIGSWTWLD